MLASRFGNLSIAFGPRKDHKVLTIQQGLAAQAPTHKNRGVGAHGFSLHADVRGGVNARHKLEPLCRYVTRPALANERLALNDQGDVVLQLKTPYADGTTHLAFTPLQFLQRLAALVPRPRFNVIRFFGIFAPNAKWRPRIVPGPANTTPDTHGDDSEITEPAPAPFRYRWATLLKRVFQIDISVCKHDGGKLNILAAITDPPVIPAFSRTLGCLPAHRRERPARFPRQVLTFSVASLTTPRFLSTNDHLCKIPSHCDVSHSR